jgi:hypothetical protein
MCSLRVVWSEVPVQDGDAPRVVAEGTEQQEM